VVVFGDTHVARSDCIALVHTLPGEPGSECRDFVGFTVRSFRPAAIYFAKYSEPSGEYGHGLQISNHNEQFRVEWMARSSLPDAGSALSLC